MYNTDFYLNFFNVSSMCEVFLINSVMDIVCEAFNKALPPPTEFIITINMLLRLFLDSKCSTVIVREKYICYVSEAPL